MNLYTNMKKSRKSWRNLQQQLITSPPAIFTKMNFYNLPVFALLVLLASCKSAPVKVDTVKKFSLTDTMMKHCEITKARIQDVKYELKLFGKVEADNNKMAHVYPVTGGIVSKVNVELGDYVEEG